MNASRGQLPAPAPWPAREASTRVTPFSTATTLRYYARTPWQPSTHQGISIWGTLAHPESTVPALSGAGIPDD